MIQRGFLTPELILIARGQGECPVCHVDWGTIQGMLADKGNGEDWTIAYCIVQNCACCQAHFPGLEPGAIRVTLLRRR